MQLTDEQAAWVVLRVGWRGDDAVVALALALATSGGNSSYGAETATEPALRRRGLWGIDLDRYPGVQKFDLADPMVTGVVAMQLWHATDRRWDWSQAWTGQGYVQYLGRARAAVAAPSKTAPIGDSPPANSAREAAATAHNLIINHAGERTVIGDPQPIDFPPHQL